MPPVVIAAGVAAAGAIGGGLLASSATRSASNTAAGVSRDTAAASNALQEKVYGSNYAVLDPYAQRGNVAGDSINALLGLPTAQGGTSPFGGANIPQDEGWANGALQAMGLGSRGNSPATLRAHLAGTVEGPISPQMRAAYDNYVSTNPMPAGNAVTAGGPNAAFQNYLNSTGYQFQVDQGNKQITQGYAGRGSLQSGAALKALQTYGQNTATGFFKDYLGLLGNQQGVGLSGASAIAGVGQNYANSVSANNNAAGTSAANAALAAGNANANLYGTIGGAIGGIANAWGSSYGPHG